MRDESVYASWDDFSVLFDADKRTFRVRYGKENIIESLVIKDIEYKGENIGGLDTFGKCLCERVMVESGDKIYLVAEFSEGTTSLKRLKIKFMITSRGVEVSAGGAGISFGVSGILNFGNGKYEDVYPVSLKKHGNIIRSAVGPASSAKDNLLFDRITDCALSLDGMKKISIDYDWNIEKYTFNAVSGTTPATKKLKLSVINNVLSDRFKVDYAPLNKNRVFRKPPAGWMTWYSVKFDACEEKVLKNAKWMSENLKDYGAECVWVDWEWCHKDMTGVRDDGCDCFNPDKERYPNGLKYVSDKIKEMGLTPALWIGFTNDCSENEYMKEHPEIVLTDHKCWAGRYFFDFSHPEYLDGFLPKALANVSEWGYDAVKYDTLPLALIWHEVYHDRMYDSSLTTKEAYRQMIKKTRSVLGEDVYMLSCSAISDMEVLWAADMFDSARVGGDIFKWEEFLKQGVAHTMRYYPLHNNLFYPDSDNVVMREEFNTEKQAASRIYFVSMLGLPMTFGDEFDALDEKRIEFIKECLPVLEIHPMDINRADMPEDILKINMSVCKKWESYNVVNVFNMLSEKKTTKVDIVDELGLENDEYIVYNYTDDKLECVTNDSFSLGLDACESKIFRVTKKLSRPQIISTSRHISQGAAEINDMMWDSNLCELTIDAQLIKDTPYTVTVFVPDGYTVSDKLEKVDNNVYKITVVPDKTDTSEIRIKFTK